MTPPGGYGVILADPPWAYDRDGPRGGVAHEYPSLEPAALASMRIGQTLGAADSILILWATWPKLTEAMALIDAWGYSYVTGFPWLKIQGVPQFDLTGDLSIRPQYGVGYWVRGCSEPILIARRGHVSPPPGGWVGLLSPNLGHSRKPDSIYQFAESLPGPYLELFARRPRAGWDAFGNEIANSIPIPIDTA